MSIRIISVRAQNKNGLGLEKAKTMTLEHLIKNKAGQATESRPYILNLSRNDDRSLMEELFKGGRIQKVVDDYESQQRELFQVENPSYVYSPEFEGKFSAYLEALQRQTPLWQQGRWAHFPWLGLLVHILEDTDFQAVRTARNRNLINMDEQNKFYNSVIGIGGLSVGNSVALAIALQGGGRRFRLADFDRLALTNLNRIRAGIDCLGMPKVDITARQIYLLNPYAEIELFREGLNKENIKGFFEGPPKLDVFIDELDNLAVKYLAREEARRLRIPVVMGADNGDNAVIDIERYDKEPDLPFFNGRIGDLSYESLAGLDKFGIGSTIAKHIGPENTAVRMQESLPEMGKTIVSWPQLGGAALLNGSAVAYCVRKILAGQPLERNRALVSLDEKLDPAFNSQAEQINRQESTDVFRKMLNL